MDSALVKEEIIREIDFLPLNVQQRVLEYIRSLTSKKSLLPLDSQNNISKLYGLLTVEEAAEMTKNIDEECKRIDINEW
jgi:hypothetical protein